MNTPSTVKVSSRYQIAIPSAVRSELKINSGDRLLIDIQDGCIILIPQPENYTNYLAGLYKEIWADIDTTNYLHEERASWNQSESD